VRLAEVEAQADPFARPQWLRIEHPGDPVLVGKLGKHQGLVAERLGERDRDLDGVNFRRFTGMNAMAGRVEIIGPQAEYHLLAGGHAVAELAGQRQCIAVGSWSASR
jgi:hypothetical protein